MGVREVLNKNRTPAIVATVVVILIALGFIISQLSSGDRPPIPMQAYYTTDDGVTYFADDVNLVAPFDYGGKTAVRANVYECGGQKFVASLQRYSADAKQKIEAAHGVGVGSVMADGSEMKAPLTGDTGWVKASSPAGSKFDAVRCPSGSDDQPKQIMP